MLQNASYMSLKNKTKQKKKQLQKKRKNLTWWESNSRLLMCKGNALSIAPCNHYQYYLSNNCI